MSFSDYNVNAKNQLNVLIVYFTFFLMHIICSHVGIIIDYELLVNYPFFITALEDYYSRLS